MISSAQDINLLLREIEHELQDIDQVLSRFDSWPENYPDTYPEKLRTTPQARPSIQFPVEQTEHLLELIGELEALLC